MSTSFCIAVLTDTLYLPGTLRLIHSWQNHNPVLPVIALSREESVLQSSELRSVAHQRIKIDDSDYQDISPYKKSRSKRHAETFYKFEAFQDFGYERTIFLDSDILCLGEATQLLEASSVSLLACLDTGFRPTRGYKGHAKEINSGVLSIHKSLQGTATVESLKQLARERPGRSGYNSGDQGILNKWIHQNQVDLELLPREYNLIKKDYNDFEGIDTCRLLHFCGRKPWFSNRNETEPLERLWLDDSQSEPID